MIILEVIHVWEFLKRIFQHCEMRHFPQFVSFLGKKTDQMLMRNFIVDICEDNKVLGPHLICQEGIQTWIVYSDQVDD